ncbi:MAG: sporulation transcriptional regulator SpoIIID [Clostridia bacterium]|nr:sporulation transcriptional regulator SpoIIID [Clostridia bacterium]
MKDYICRRVLLLSEYIAEHNATVRETAKHFGVSKSTVHKDVTERLRSLNSILYGQVQHVLENNKEERHIRGGLATREKYLKQKKDA